MNKNEILEKACFETINRVKVLYLKGKPYEMGYQHGYLLADKIDLMVNRTLLATAAYVAAQTGSDLDKAEEILWMGQKAAEPFLPQEFREEMKGIADGVKDAGINVTLEQILLWNTNYDQWCIYCHPDYWQGENQGNNQLTVKLRIMEVPSKTQSNQLEEAAAVFVPGESGLEVMEN